MEIRKARLEDVDEITALYDAIHDAEEAGTGATEFQGLGTMHLLMLEKKLDI